LYPGIRPLEALRLFASYYDTPDDPGALLDLVGLRDAQRTPARRLSGGQRQRLALALALVGRPDVAFLDEPTAGMDPHARATTWDVIRALRTWGAAVLLTTHAMDEAEALADRVVIIDHGQVVASGTPDELMRDAKPSDTRFTARAGLDTDDLAGALGLARRAVNEERPGRYVIASTATPEIVAALTAWLLARGEALGDLQAGRRSLEEVFLRLTGDGV
jgi:ABC-2 type transport system ATP-binding protein